MSIKLMSKVFDSDLPTTEKFVLLAMADYASESGESIFPSIATLAQKTSLSDRSVQNAIQSLIEKGYLELACKGGGRKNTNRYRILCSRFSESSTPIPEKGETGTGKGETGTEKGAARSPDPSLTTIEPSNIYSAENVFLSQLDGLIGCPIGGRTDIETAEIMLQEYGIDRVRRAASWAHDKAFRSMQTALRSMNTALKNGGFHEQKPGQSKKSNTSPAPNSQAAENRRLLAEAAARDAANQTVHAEVDENGNFIL